VEADSFRVLTSLVEEGLGYALLPPSSVRSEVADGRLETAAISNPAPIRELTIASPIEHPGSTAITLVTNLLRAEISACREEGLWDINLT
jgi:DNA-binding transcriptional LysR family regulator